MSVRNEDNRRLRLFDGVSLQGYGDTIMEDPRIEFETAW